MQVGNSCGTLKEKLQTGKLALGTWVNVLHGPALIRMLGTAGFDFVSLDMQHSPVTLETIAAECMTARLCGITPLVRSYNPLDFRLNSRLLDIGAGGLVVPDVETPELVEETVKSLHYFHGGTRGFVNMCYASGFSPNSVSNMEKSDEETVLVVQIESAKGVARIDEILSVPGIDVVVIGRGDLAHELDVSCQLDHPLVSEMVAKVYNAAARHGVTAGLLCPSAEKAKVQIANGAKFIHYSNEQAILLHAYRSFLDTLRPYPPQAE